MGSVADFYDSKQRNDDVYKVLMLYGIIFISSINKWPATRDCIYEWIQ